MENPEKPTSAPVEFEEHLQKCIRSAADLSMSYSKLNADQRLGVTHAVVGLLFIILGISFFFQSLLLSLGNGLVIYGIIEIMGVEAFLKFVKPADNNKSNYGIFVLGLSLILIMNGWGMIGFILELYSIYQTLRERCDHSELTELLSVAQNMIFQRLRYLPFLKSFIGTSEAQTTNRLESLQRAIIQASDQQRLDADGIERIGDVLTQSKRGKGEISAEHPESDTIVDRDHRDSVEADHRQQNMHKEALQSPDVTETRKGNRGEAPEEGLRTNGFPVTEMDASLASEQVEPNKAGTVGEQTAEALQVGSDERNGSKATEGEGSKKAAKHSDARTSLTTPEVPISEKADEVHSTERATSQESTAETIDEAENPGEQLSSSAHQGNKHVTSLAD